MLISVIDKHQIVLIVLKICHFYSTTCLYFKNQKIEF